MRIRLDGACSSMAPLILRFAAPLRSSGRSSMLKGGRHPAHRTSQWSSCRRSLHASPSSQGPSISDVLPHQDPYRRIRYDAPSRFVGMNNWAARMHILRKAFPNLTRAEAHLVPLWTLVFLSHQQRTYKRRETGEGVTLIQSDVVPDVHWSYLVMTVAAVEPSHWASGLVWDEDLDTLFRSQAAFPPALDPRVFSQPDKAEPFLPEEWDPTTAPLFAMGPPRLTTGEAQQVVEVLKVVGNDVSEVYEMLRPISIFAFPSYRLAYKLDLPGLAVWADGLSVDPDHGRDHYISGDGTVDPDLTLALRRPFIEGGRSYPRTFRHLDDENSPAVAQLILNAMRRRPVPPAVWEDEQILPYDEESAYSAWEALMYAEACVREGSAPPAAPRYPVRTSSQASDLSSQLLRKSPRRGTSASAKPAPKADPVHAKRRARSFPIPDPKGWYKILGISPTTAVLDPTKEAEVNRFLSVRWKRQAQVVHPDKMGGSHKACTDLNEAKDALDTLAKRKAYSLKRR